MDQPQQPPRPTPDSVPNPAVRRLSLYLRQLEALKRTGRSTVSSKQLGQSLGLTDAQVQQLIATTKPHYHVSAGLHSQETNPPEAVIELAQPVLVEVQRHLAQLPDHDEARPASP